LRPEVRATPGAKGDTHSNIDVDIDIDNRFPGNPEVLHSAVTGKQPEGGRNAAGGTAAKQSGDVNASRSLKDRRGRGNGRGRRHIHRETPVQYGTMRGVEQPTGPSDREEGWRFAPMAVLSWIQVGFSRLPHRPRFGQVRAWRLPVDPARDYLRFLSSAPFIIPRPCSTSLNFSIFVSLE
jgi:hypothetical protein